MNADMRVGVVPGIGELVPTTLGPMTARASQAGYYNPSTSRLPSGLVEILVEIKGARLLSGPQKRWIVRLIPYLEPPPGDGRGRRIERIIERPRRKRFG